MNSRCKSPRTSVFDRSRNGFTLVEILTVIAIIGIMSGMIVVASAGVARSAREARTKSIVAAVDSVIQEKYEALRFRALAVEIPDLFLPSTALGDDSEIGYEVLSHEAARVRLIMLRDLMRMELPERYSDIVDGPVVIKAACTLVKVDGGVVVARRDQSQRSERKWLDVSWTDSASSTRRNLRSRLLSVTTTDPTVLKNQGAECLYLIMASSFIGGSPAIDSIPTANIADTDNDGLPEIVDGWDRPLGFVRWPVGYRDVETSIDTTVGDDFDLFGADYANRFSTSSPPVPSSSAVPLPIDINTGATNRTPWSMRPLILSAGGDGEFGISLDPIDNTGTPLPGFSYTAAIWNLPVNAANMNGEELGGLAPTSIQYPDPYFRRFTAANDVVIRDRSLGATSYTTKRRLPGEDLAPSDDFLSLMIDPRSADDITNYSLQAKE